MALSRELIRRLDIEEEPLAKRLKLAENTFASEDLPITRKEDLVLTWLCKIIENHDNTDKEVWDTLSRCLRLKNASSNVVLKSNVKQTLIDALIKKLNFTEHKELNGIVDACEMIFASRETRRYFQTNVLSLGALIRALLLVNSKCRKSLEITDNNQRVRQCIIAGMECFVACYKQSAHKDDFADTFLSQILYPLCSLVDAKQNDKLGAETHKCLQQLIFGKSRYSQFKEYDESNSNDFATRVFNELKKNAEVFDVDITVVVFLYVFRAAVGSYKNDSMAIDSIFRYLIDSASHAKIKVFTLLRQQLIDITFDYQNKIGSSTLFEYLQKFIDEIISTEHLNSVHYEALSTIAVLNPLIIESKIHNILKRILLEHRVNECEIRSYNDLMIVIIEAGVRLRREQKLVSWILKAVEERIDDNYNDDLIIEKVFPMDFKKKFSESVGNMTSMQTIGVLRSLIFHLNNSAESLTKNEYKATFMLEISVDLISAYFEGVRIFDNTVPVSGYDKFVQGLRELGKTISLLTKTLLETKSNDKIIIALLTLTWYWDNMHHWMKYYVPEAVPEELDFPISDDEIEQIAANIGDLRCKNAMNKIVIQQIGRNLRDDKPIDFSKLLDGLKNSWSVILDQNPQIVSFMNNLQIVELVELLSNDLASSKNHGAESMMRLNADSVQNDERLVNALVCQTISDLASRVSESTTKIIAKHFDVKKIMHRGNVSKLMKKISNDLMKKEWICLNEESMSVVQNYLKILLCLPLTYIAPDLRTILILVAYSIKKECETNETIVKLCRDITMDASEKSDIAIIDLFDPDSLIDELTEDKSIQRVMESSLRNVTSWDTLKILINKSQTSVDSTILFLECIERVKPKLKNNEKEIFRKAEEKLCKKLFRNIGEELKDCQDIKCLNMVLKFSATSNKIPDNLNDMAKSALHRIFVLDDVKDEKLIEEGLKLVNVVLKHRTKLELEMDIVNKIWIHMLNKPRREIALPLLDRTKPIALKELFTSLHAKTISGLMESNEKCFNNCLIVWDCITSVQMGGERQKHRTVALQNLLQVFQISKIPVEFWPSTLKLIQNILSENLHVIEKGIDVVTLLLGRSLREAELSACEKVLSICLSLVKFNTSNITDRLPVLLGLYRKIVRLVVCESRKDNDPYNQQRFGRLALDIEKFTNALVKLKKDLARISAYMIADLVDVFSEGVIPPRVKAPLEDCVGHFLSISDQHTISLLSRTLPAATQGIFRTLYDTYNKFYKFTGKI